MILCNEFIGIYQLIILQSTSTSTVVEREPLQAHQASSTTTSDNRFYHNFNQEYFQHFIVNQHHPHHTQSVSFLNVSSKCKSFAVTVYSKLQ